MHLTDLQKRMLKAQIFYIDGWMSKAGKIAAEDLLNRGYMTKRESGDEQYTVWNFTITDAGRNALADHEKDCAQ